MDAATANLINILQQRVDDLLEAGDVHEALHAASAAVEKTQQALTPDLDSIDAFASSLEIRGNLYRQLERFDEARDDYRQAIDQLQNRPDRLAQTGRIHAALGATYDALGQPERAEQSWEKAVSFFEKHDPPLELDIAAMANNLGFIKKAAGNHDAAETCFLRALEILHKHLGQNHEETATVTGNLGVLYQASGYYEQAREMHMIALETRRNVLGEQHPDTAQSHNNLALALAATGDRAWARRHFESALACYEALGPDHHADLEAVVFNYCEFLEAEGEAELAQTIAGRVQELFDSVRS
jgi:tetratricopeptide (TPR) repeat protein